MNSKELIVAMSKLVIEQIDDVVQVIDHGKYFYIDKSIYSKKTNKKLYTFEKGVRGVIQMKVGETRSMETDLLIYELDKLAILFVHNRMLTYNLEDDTIKEGIKVDGYKFGKNYLFLQHNGMSSIYNLDLEYVGISCGIVSEIKEDLFLTVSSDRINIMKLDICIYRKEIKIDDPKKVSCQIVKILIDDKIEECINIVEVPHRTILWLLMKEVEVDLTKVCNKCLETPKYKVALIPCGHKRYCEGCAIELKECVVCKSTITAYLRIQK